MKQVLKGVGAALIVGVPLGLYFHFWLRGTVLFTALLVGILGLGIIIVVGTRTDEEDAAADLAWRAAAADLPPVSDRRSMEATQRRMPGPASDARPAAGPATPRR